MYLASKYKKSFYFCLFLSLAFHIGAIVYLNHYFSIKKSKAPIKEKIYPSVEENRCKKILPVSFQKRSKKNEKQIFLPIKQHSFLQPKLLMPLEKIDHFPLKKIIQNKEAYIPCVEKKLEKKHEKVSFSSQIHDEFFSKIEFPPYSLPMQKKEKNFFFAKKEKIVMPVLSLKNINSEIVPVQFCFCYKEQIKTEIKSEKSLWKKSRFINKATLSLPKLDELNTLSCGEDFDFDLSYMRLNDEEGYLFSITLIPKMEFDIKKLKQNFYFLFDRSNSIQSDRLLDARHALSGALSYLSMEDFFTIYAFDGKVDILPGHLQKVSPFHISQAKKFLLNQQLASFFSSTDYEKLFKEIRNENFSYDELNTVILITNGDGLKKRRNLQALENWSKQNEKKFILHILSLAEDKNRDYFEFFSRHHKGKVILSSTSKGLKRNLIKLIKAIDSPLARDLSYRIYAGKDNPVSLYPKADQLPHLYQGEPYVILGKIKKLEDFVLFLQGKNAESWFNIKKNISFNEGKEGGRKIEKEWLLQKSYENYRKYLYGKNQEQLLKAKELLEKAKEK